MEIISSKPKVLECLILIKAAEKDGNLTFFLSARILFSTSSPVVPGLGASPDTSLLEETSKDSISEANTFTDWDPLLADSSSELLPFSAVDCKGDNLKACSNNRRPS